MNIKVGYRYYVQYGVFLQMKGISSYKIYFTITQIKKDNIKIRFDNKESKGKVFVPAFKTNFIESMNRGDIVEDKEYNKILKRKDLIDDIL